MDSGGTIYSIAVVLHVFSAIICVGGVLFMAMAALPVSRRFDEKTRRSIKQKLGNQFRPMGWTALTILHT